MSAASSDAKDGLCDLCACVAPRFFFIACIFRAQIAVPVSREGRPSLLSACIAVQDGFFMPTRDSHRFF